uniref:glycyl-radical enzyme activating protein n=1 Tax=Alistipes sp. D31t1_170403_E11 TaxID=2787128 RepID=UPI0018998931|nr:glycyl-radical enzyme activating protein [Alistipes sp. D31t1_170403_E11]
MKNAITGMITRVQRMSIHDGPGIRTTLFLKGCNFRCRWCHNPETWRRETQVERIGERCVACGACTLVCGSGALRMENGAVRLDRERCDACGRCADVCPAQAMNLVGKAVSVDDVMQELQRDIPYFEESGGGVTVSGGEPLLQPLFVRELLLHCRAGGIPTAVETNLSVPSGLIAGLLPLVDLWMCDLKAADDGLHRRWTGVSNARTVANLRLLGERNVPLIVRTPVVPGVNDTPEAIGAICTLLKGVGSLLYYELLGFHTLGADKFTGLGMENPMPGAEPLPPERLESLRAVAAGTGINVK